MAVARRVRAPKITETQEHLAIAGYFKKIGLGGCAVAFHIRNEQATKSQRINAVRMGILRGVADWLIVDGGRAIFAEIKPRGWRAQKERTGNYTEHELRQLRTHRMLRGAGASVVIVETLDELLQELEARGVPLRSESISAERIRRGMQKVLAETAE